MALRFSVYLLIFDGCLRRSYAGDGHAEGGAGYIVHAELGAEFHGGGFATMLAANTYLEFGTGCAAFLNAHLYELAHTFLIKDFEGIGLDDAVFLIEFEELGSVIAGETEGHLGKVIGAEGEEFGYLGDLICYQGSAGYLDHSTDEVGEGFALFLEYFGGSSVDDVGLVLDLLEGADEGYHDFGMHIHATGLDGESGLDDGTGLHLGDLGICDAEATATVAEHGVEFLEGVDFCLHLSECDAHIFGEFFLSGGLVGYELVQRGIEQTDGDSVAVHGLEDAFEVAALHGEEFGECTAASFHI